MRRSNKYNLTIGMLSLILVIAVLLISLNKNQIQSVFKPTKELPIYSVDRDDNKISVSFDCAWGDEFTVGILDTLDKYNVKATFFVVGFWVDKYPHQILEIQRRGHEIGNHSTTHPEMNKLSKEQIAKELNITGDKITELTKTKPILFRPPFGAYNDSLIQVARELGYYTIQWDVDSLDWKELGAEPVIDKVVKNVSNGSIVLFHNNAKYILEYLPTVLEKLQEKGYELIPISELIYKDDFQMDNSGRQIYLK